MGREEYNRGVVEVLWKKVGICGKVQQDFTIPVKAGIDIKYWIPARRPE